VATSYAGLPDKLVSAPGGVDYAYPDAAHGFLFRHHAEFAADVEAFLGDPH
jgi:hypothetical protein